MDHFAYSVIYSFFAVLISVFVTIIIYFAIDGRLLKRGIKNFNVVYIILIFLVAFILRILSVWYASGEQIDFDNGFAKAFEEIYKTLGGITFEGQELDSAPLAWKCVYFSSIAWLACSNAILIGVGVSYEFRCAVRFLPKKILPYFGFPKGPIAIFTTVTEESLTLAESISKGRDYKTKYEICSGKQINAKRKKHPLIIFASDEIGPFNKENELHQRLRMANYFYFNLNKRNKEKNKENKKLYLRNHLLYRLFGFKLLFKWFLFNFICKREIYIFALDTDVTKNGNESKNSDIIFDDIKAMSQRIYPCLKSYNKSKFIPHVDYYYLSNYESNQDFIDNYLKEIFKDYGNNAATDMVPRVFGITPLNESILTGEDLTKIRQKTFESTFNQAIFDENSINGVSNNTHNALVIGFDKNGQQSLLHLYADTVGGELDGHGIFVPHRFHANIIDKEIEDKVYGFEATHPLVICKKEYINIKDIETSYAFENIEKAKINSFYYKYENLSSIYKYMAFPYISYSQMNVFGADFSAVIQDILDASYDSILICLGDDEINLRCVNIILQNIRQTINASKFKSNRNINIYVNLRNKDNNLRVYWKDGVDTILFPNIKVFVYGNLNSLYSNTLMKIDTSVNVHKSYSETENKYISSEDSKVEMTHYSEMKEALDSFYSLSLYKKKSNEACTNFSTYFRIALSKTDLDKPLVGKDSDTTEYDELKKEFLGKNNIIDALKNKNSQYQTILNDKTIIEDITKSLGYEETDKIKFTFPNYVKIKSFIDNDYFAAKGKLWLYFAEFEHMRWCRHMIAYGRTYGEIPAEGDRYFKFKGHYKDSLLISDCLIPYSRRPHLSKRGMINVFAKYMPRKTEDYDYVILQKALIKEQEKN